MLVDEMIDSVDKIDVETSLCAYKKKYVLGNVVGPTVLESYIRHLPHQSNSQSSVMTILIRCCSALHELVAFLAMNQPSIMEVSSVSAESSHGSPLGDTTSTHSSRLGT